MRRSTFLRGIVASGATLAAACIRTDTAASPTPPATPPPTPVATTPAPTPTIGPPDWDGLRVALRDRLVRPGDPAYDDARVVYNTRFDSIRPVAVARCASVDDIRACVRFARAYRIPLALRSGGHSYGGWSTGPGLIIDVSRLAAIDVQGDRVTIGAGAQLIDVYDAVAARGRGIPAGSCPTVGVTGLTLGGGVGVLTRVWGLTCDDLIGAQVVTADGQLRDCDLTRDADLFWALRGGGGGSFGVVTSLTLRTHAVGSLALAFLTWPWDRAAAVVAGWQAWMSRAPDELWSTMHLDVVNGGAAVAMHAVHLGTANEMRALLDGLVALTSAPDYRESGSRPYREVMLLEAGCLGGSAAQCHLRGTTAEGRLSRETFVATSVIAPRPLSTDAIGALVNAVASAAGRPDVGGTAVLLDSLGGAVSRVAPSETAFVHRDAFAVAQLYGSWDAAAPAAIVDGTTAWLRQLHATVRPLIGTGAYVNYADPDLTDFANAYWGANYARLQQVKAKYDPDRVFDFPQAVRP